MVVELNGDGLSERDVVAVARRGGRDALGARARRDAGQRGVVATLADSGEPVYGVSTGFGSLATVRIPGERREELQRALIRSHAAGMGPPVEREVVRAMMLLRARSLAMGYLGRAAGRRRGDPGAAQRRPHAGGARSTARSARAAISRRSPTARWR